MDQKSTEVAKDFLKFTNYLIKLKNAIDHQVIEMDRDREFNLFD